MITFLQATFEGLSLGAVYSLVAIGFVLIYKATDVLSFAQPALVVVGAGLISALAVDRGVPFWIAFIVGILLTGIIGLVMERTFLRPMVGEPVFSVAILTIGIDILLRTVLNNWIGLNPRYLGDPFQSFGNFGSVNVGGVTLKYLEIAALFTGVVLIILLSVFFKRSKYGVAMMATSYDQEAALAQGINVGRIFGLVWLISGVLAGFAGFFITGGFNTLTQASFLSALKSSSCCCNWRLRFYSWCCNRLFNYWTNTRLCGLLSINVGRGYWLFTWKWIFINSSLFNYVFHIDF